MSHRIPIPNRQMPGEVPAVGAEPDHEYLIESERGDLGDAIVVGIQEVLPVGHHGVVHGVPVTASSEAASLTLRAFRPTWIVAHRAAREVRT